VQHLAVESNSVACGVSLSIWPPDQLVKFLLQHALFASLPPSLTPS